MLNSILRLNVTSGGNIEFTINNIDQYTAGIANGTRYDTKFTVASSVDFNVLMYARMAHDENGIEIYPTTSIDITDQKKAAMDKELLQKKLSQAQKMESIGTLAGGIAHEFNNIISIIIGNNELIMEDLPEWSLSRKTRDPARRGSWRKNHQDSPAQDCPRISRRQTGFSHVPCR